LAETIVIFGPRSPVCRNALATSQPSRPGKLLAQDVDEIKVGSFMHKNLHGVKTIAESAMARKFTWLLVWR
jgi:hypothetical protein